MKANELRINNALLYDGEVKIVSSIHSDDTIRFYDKEKGSIGCFKIRNKLIQPIPLTEEWLLRFCFKKVRYEKYAHEKLDKLKAYPHVIKDGYGFYIQGAYTLPNIKYVHQLQNLYFALTGEELKIQL